MQPTYLIAGVIAFVLLAVNTPSVATWTGSLFKRSQPKVSNGQKVRTQHPFSLQDAEGRAVEFVLTHQQTVDLHEDIGTQLQLDRPVIRANQVNH